MTPITRAVIPAAGLGTRFLPITRSMPKEMLPVGRKPVIQYVIEEAVAAGVNEVLIITGRGKRALEDYFDRTDPTLESVESEQLDLLLDMVNLFFVRQKQPRGLGDAIRYAESFASDEPFLVLLGDTFTRPSCLPSLLKAHGRHGLSTVAVQRHRPSPSLAVRCGGRLPVRARAPPSGDARREAGPGQGSIKPRYPRCLPPHAGGLHRTRQYRAGPERGDPSLTDALRRVADEEGLIACISRCRRFDIGEPTSWLLANIEPGPLGPSDEA